MEFSLKSLKKNIIFVDDSLVIFNKPNNFLSVQGKGFKGLNCLSLNLKKLFSKIYVVHRLDMATSGLIIFARKKYSQVNLCKQFQSRRVKKEYIAKVHGFVEGQGSICIPIIADIKNKPKQKVCFFSGKNAYTRYKNLHYNEMDNVSRVLLEPYTGRTHQLRVHMKFIGHTILGDRLYSHGQGDVDKMYLHSSKISFEHPTSSKILEFNSTPDF